MLPGLRLMAIGFLCSFVAVFAGLRMVAALNKIHAGLPIMAAQAEPAMQVAPAIQAPPTALTTDSSHPVQPPPRVAALTATAAPVLYDLRFVASPAAPQLASATPQAIERVLPRMVQPTPIAPRIEETFKEFEPEAKAAKPAAATARAVEPRASPAPEAPGIAEPTVIAAIDAAAAQTLALVPTEPPVMPPPDPVEVLPAATVATAPIAPAATLAPSSQAVMELAATAKPTPPVPNASQPSAPVEVAMIPAASEPALEAPKPAHVIAKRAVRHVRHRRHIRMVRRAAAPAASGAPAASAWGGHQP